MEKLPRRRPQGHVDPQSKLRTNIPGLIVDHAIAQVNRFIGDLLDALDGITFGIFNLDSLADRFRGTESRLDREVVRLDNRIDQISDELGVIQIATFGYSGRWWKPAGAYGDIILDCLGGASGGGRSNNGGSGGAGRAGLGGWSGGWDKKVMSHDQCPLYIDIVVGETAAGATSDGGNGSAGKTTTFYAPDGTILAQATGGDSAGRAYGIGNNTFRMRGGLGGDTTPTNGRDGSAGSFDPGGKGGVTGSSAGEGENGFSAPAAKIGVGSAGGGGGANSFLTGGSGAKGGDGGWPSGPGGGGGAYRTFGFAGNGGIGAAGAGYISTRLSETRVIPPSVPAGLTASGVAGTTATITWAPSTDDFGVDQYEVLVNDVVRGYTEATNFPLTGLAPSTAYTVKLRAVDDNGNWSAFSTVLNFTTTA